jgi:hypothetical protein
MRTEEGAMKAKEARAAWNKENMKTVGANLKKEDFEKLAMIADRRGTKPNRLVRELVMDFIEKETRSGMQPTEPHAIDINPKVAERLKEFTTYVPGNPDSLANMVLNQWMDAQLEMYAHTWPASEGKLRRMQRRK